MDLKEIKTTFLPRLKRFRVGRGSSSGAGRTSGQGGKGQNSRSGFTKPPIFEGGTMPLYRRLPKRGFHHTAFQKYWVSLNIDELNNMKPGDEINIETIQDNSLLKIKNSRIPYLKILGRGELKVESLKIKAHKVSAKAKEKIEQAKGTIEIIEIPKKNPRIFKKREKA